MNTNTNSSEISYETKMVIVILLLLFVFPAGLILMWIWMRWSMWLKILITTLPFIFAILIIIFVFAILGIVFSNPSVQKSMREQIQQQNNNVQISQSPNQNQMDISTWKTYTGVGYSFKYPMNGEVIPSQTPGVFISYKQGTTPYWTFTVSVEENPNHLTTKQIVDKIITNARNDKNNPVAKENADQLLKTMKPYTNAQIDGIALQTIDEGYPSGFGNVVEATANKIYIFRIGNGSGGRTDDTDEKLLDQILSTFRLD